MKLFSESINLLEQSLNFSATKQRTIANNIANVDTPHYKAKKVSFQTELNEATLKANRTHHKHLEFSTTPQSKINVHTVRNTNYNHNGNNVDIDVEMTEMAKNQIFYNVLADRINGKFNGLKEVLKGGN